MRCKSDKLNRGIYPVPKIPQYEASFPCRCKLSGSTGLCTGREELRHQQEGLVPFVSKSHVLTPSTG